jgi:hypothetical protein
MQNSAVSVEQDWRFYKMTRLNGPVSKGWWIEVSTPDSIEDNYRIGKGNSRYKIICLE